MLFAYKLVLTNFRQKNEASDDFAGPAWNPGRGITKDNIVNRLNMRIGFIVIDR